MSSDEHPLLADFGLAGIGDTMTTAAASTATEDRSIRWSAPELHDPQKFGLLDFRRTRATDIYAFGCLGLEVSIVKCMRNGGLDISSQLFTGQLPFAEIPLRLDAVVIQKVSDGHLPAERTSMPQQADFDIWPLFVRCWSPNASDRPQIISVTEVLHVQLAVSQRNHKQQLSHSIPKIVLNNNLHQAGSSSSLDLRIWPPSQGEYRDPFAGTNG
jgi:serine/threonine protein kinase